MTSNYVLQIAETIQGPVDLFHAKGIELKTNPNFTYENNTLSAPNVEAETIMSKSDIKFKENIQNISNCLEKLVKLQAKCYNYIHDEDKTLHNGFIAQDVKEIFPEVVHVDPKGNLYISYIEILPIITEAIKELFEIVLSLKS